METDLAYLAGMIDGEGHFYLAKCKNGQGRPYLMPRMLFVQSDKNNGAELVNWAKDRFGGYVHCQGELWRWQVSGKKAIELANIIRPYLIVKREQVKRLTDWA